MFERYTEKARRVIFFARYEASQFGSAYIEPEHLLLGLIRDEPRLRRWLPKAEPEAIRRRIESSTEGRQSIPTSVDLPLSRASKDVLFQARDEADRTKSGHIGTEHLLLGLLQQDCSTAKLLVGFGADLGKLRTRFENEPEPPSLRTADAFSLSDRIRSGRSRLLRKQKWHWQRTAWKARDVAVHRATGEISFDLSLAEDTTNFELVKGGWKKDLCAICDLELFEAEDKHGTGYTNGQHWICVECYETFWSRPDFTSGSYSDLT